MTSKPNIRVSPATREAYDELMVRFRLAIKAFANPIGEDQEFVSIWAAHESEVEDERIKAVESAFRFLTSVLDASNPETTGITHFYLYAPEELDEAATCLSDLIEDAGNLLPAEFTETLESDADGVDRWLPFLLRFSPPPAASCGPYTQAVKPWRLIWRNPFRDSADAIEDHILGRSGKSSVPPDYDAHETAPSLIRVPRKVLRTHPTIADSIMRFRTKSHQVAAGTRTKTLCQLKRQQNGIATGT